MLHAVAGWFVQPRGPVQVLTSSPLLTRYGFGLNLAGSAVLRALSAALLGHIISAPARTRRLVRRRRSHERRRFWKVFVLADCIAAQGSLTVSGRVIGRPGARARCGTSALAGMATVECSTDSSRRIAREPRDVPVQSRYNDAPPTSPAKPVTPPVAGAVERRTRSRQRTATRTSGTTTAGRRRPRFTVHLHVHPRRALGTAAERLEQPVATPPRSQVAGDQLRARPVSANISETPHGSGYGHSGVRTQPPAVLTRTP